VLEEEEEMQAKLDKLKNERDLKYLEEQLEICIQAE
jgi:hypothetical protein